MGLTQGLNELENVAVLGSFTSGTFAVATFGGIAAQSTQHGRVSGAGIANAVVVSFPTAFASAPDVVVQSVGSVASNFAYVAGTSAGSFVFNATGSNTTYIWQAIA